MFLKCYISLFFLFLALLSANENQIEPSCPSQELRMQLITAVSDGNAMSVQSLLEAGADPNTISAFDNMLMIAAYKGRTDILSILLDYGANVNATTYLKETALMAGAKVSTEIVSFLLRAGAEINAKDSVGNTALMKAAMLDKNLPILRLLIDNGIDVTARNKFGESALDLAAECHAWENCRLLQEAITRSSSQ